MKRLLCIVGSMNAGGAETFLMKLYRSLDKSQYQMDFIVAIKEKGYYDEEILSLGGRIFHVSPKSVGFFKNFNEIINIVRINQYKSVLRVSQHSLSATDLLAARFGGAKKLSFRSSNSNTLDASTKEFFLHKMFLFMPKLFSNVKIAPSTEAAEFMFGKDCVKNGKATILHNALDLDTYRFDEKWRVKVRSEFEITNETLVIGHVGRFMKQKNHEFLINVFNEIHRMKSRSKLLLIGTGELESQIKMQVKKLGLENDVIFAGIRSDIPAVLSAMDVFLFPSFYEGMPNTVIEAQSTGLPCIVSDTITREAKITDIVNYVSLNESTTVWASKVSKQAELVVDRETYHVLMKKSGYDIQDCVGRFIDLVFT